MPEVRAALPESRLVPLLAGVAVLLGVEVVWSTVAHVRGTAREVRGLRARLVTDGAHVDRERRENAELIAAADRLVRAAAVLHDRATEARRAVHMEESTETVVEPTARVALRGAPFMSDHAARALGDVAWVESQLATAADSLAVVTALLKQRSEDAGAPPSLWPVRGVVTSTFGVRESPYGDGREMHPGIDIQAPFGEPVSAGGAGEVIYAGRDAGYGRLVVVDHGGDLETLYGHLSRIAVREGQRVSRGQELGAVGASGRATGAHLHYEVRQNDEPVNPRRYLVD